MAPDAPPAAVGSVFATARRRNPALGVTGALLFDGECFAQLVEGEHDVVRALVQRIEADPRHVDMVVLLDEVDGVGRGHADARAEGPSWPRQSRWAAGWAVPDSVQALRCAPAPLPGFLLLLASSDVA